MRVKRPKGFDRPSQPGEPEQQPEDQKKKNIFRRDSSVKAKDVEGSKTSKRLKPAKLAKILNSSDDTVQAQFQDEVLVDSESQDFPNISVRQAKRERVRIERQEVRRFTLRLRRRRIFWVSVLFSLVLIAAASAAIVFSPFMSLKTITVNGTSSINSQEIVDALHEYIGQPLALLNKSDVERELQKLTRIEKYDIEFLPPDELIITILERTPKGIIQRADGFHLVDSAQVSLLVSPERDINYPLIVLPEGEQAEKDAAFRAIVNVLRVLPASIFAQVDTVTAKTRDDVSFTLRGTGATVLWGDEHESELKALSLERLLQNFPGARILNVSSPHSVTIQ